MGTDFKGVFDRVNQQVHFFERTAGGAYRAPVTIADLHDRCCAETNWDEALARQVMDELEMLEGAGAEFRPRSGAGRSADPRFLRQREQQLRRAAAAG